jgi:hypothetical protein
LSYLVDTNVLSELARKLPDSRVVVWASGVRRAALSVVTVEEIHFGLAWRPNPTVLARLQELIEAHFDVLPITEAIALRAGALRGQLRAVGRTRTQADMFVAATAAVHGLVLVTRNAQDFEGCGVSVLNPFGA